MLYRLLYSAIITIAMPFAYLHLWRRARDLPTYQKRLLEHFGVIRTPLQTNSIWLHAASVGEVNIAITIIKRLQSEYPSMPITLSTMTATGAATAEKICQGNVQHVFFPFDNPFIIKRFLAKLQPRGLLLIEKELWPNVLHYCHEVKIPVALLNARISEKSFATYQRMKSLSKFMLTRIGNIAAQTQQDSQYLSELGVNPENISVAGNIKFDIALPDDIQLRAQCLREQLGNERIIFVGGSTHESEESILLDCYQQLKSDFPELLLVLVPRHPQRFDAVATLCQQRKLNLIRRTEAKACDNNCDVFLCDSMGELTYLYKIANIAFVGGSFVAIGGHNVLEPIALGVATLCGPQTFNFTEIINLLSAVNAISLVEDSQQLQEKVTNLLRNSHHRDDVIHAGLKVIRENKGALERNLLACRDIVV